MSPNKAGAVPKIDAPTVAEHRANQERALLDAARELLLAGGRAAITPAAVGAAAGLARSSVYKYFSSGEEILTRIAAEAFADWGARVSAAVGRAADADGRVDAYVRTTLELADSGAHRVAVLGGGLPQDARARERLAQAHRDLAEPLVAALAERGDADPVLPPSSSTACSAVPSTSSMRGAGPRMSCPRRWSSFAARSERLPPPNNRQGSPESKEEPCSW